LLDAPFLGQEKEPAPAPPAVRPSEGANLSTVQNRVNGSINANRNINVNVDHGGIGWGVAAGVAGAVAVGTLVRAVSSTARPVVYGRSTCYVNGNTYYKQCYQGGEWLIAWCIIRIFEAPVTIPHPDTQAYPSPK
jgi:hypothetical protein